MITETSYWRCLGDRDGAGYVLAKHKPEKNGFSVTVSLHYLHRAHEVFSRIARVLDLHADPRVIHRALLAAGLPESSINPGLRLPGCWSVFEAGCRAILGQQVSVKAAITHVSTLTRELGAKTAHGQTFPTPESVAGSGLAFLRMPGARKQALINFARYCSQKPDIEAREVLALKGIGPWTVSYLQMRGQSEPDIYLDGDLIVRKIAAQFDLNPTRANPWRSYLTMQLWQLA